MSRAWPSVVVVLGVGAWPSHPAVADQFEATLALRPLVGSADVAEDGTSVVDHVPFRGGAVEGTYGLRDWLDLGGELMLGRLGEARYDRVTLNVDDSPMTGPLKRISQTAQLRGVARVRGGVAWIPTAQLALGLGPRQRTSALLDGTSSRGPATYIPDGQEAGFTFDLVAAVRVGFEHRFGRHWSAGVSVGAARWIGVTTPDVTQTDVAIAVARLWYPR